MIQRDLAPRLLEAAERFPAVTLVGPRQSGKSTLCRALFPQLAYSNLEAPDVRAFAHEDPRAFLAGFPGGAVLDEIQRAPELPSYLQGLIDADPRPGRWILTGSQNLLLVDSVSQSLAGRTALLQLLPLSRGEALRFESEPRGLEETLWTGGYPRIFDQGIPPADWLAAYVATYVERDVRSLSRIGDLVVFQRFLELCAGRTAQLLNYSALAADSGIAQPTAKAWMSVLEASFLTFRLPALHTNLKKRLVKQPKLHFVDVGLAAWLLGIREPAHLRAHPLRGALFETWVVSEIHKQRTHAGETRGLYHYRDRDGVKADLVIESPEGLTLVEAKAAQTPSASLADGVRRLRERLDRPERPCRAVVVYGGEEIQDRGGVRLLPWQALATEAGPLGGKGAAGRGGAR